jgi:ATP phosphoribosyltransferase
VNDLGLTIAVPRGALFGETLDVLEGIGVDTGEVRRNDRKLLFADVGIVTMRPSDVPTYVEAGAADLGITGKDVLLEQAGRQVFELLDLGYGRCRMVLATVDSGSCASRRSTPGSPAATSRTPAARRRSSRSRARSSWRR